VQVRRRIAVTTSRPGVVFSLVALGVLLLDQLSKYLVRTNMEPGDALVLISDVLAVTYVRNIGGAFGMLAGYRTLFIAVMVLVLIGVAIYWYRTRPRFLWLSISLGLITAGALGNAIDRLDTGLVTDFIDVLGPVWPVFNVADSAVVVGVGMLLVWITLAPEEALAAEMDAQSEESSEAESRPDEPVEAEHG
jgi:signal peptidase II